MLPNRGILCNLTFLLDKYFYAGVPESTPFIREAFSIRADVFVMLFVILKLTLSNKPGTALTAALSSWACFGEGIITVIAGSIFSVSLGLKNPASIYGFRFTSGIFFGLFHLRQELIIVIRFALRYQPEQSVHASCPLRIAHCERHGFLGGFWRSHNQDQLY